MRQLDQNEIRRLYVDEGMTLVEVIAALGTSYETLMANWPADVPRRLQGVHRSVSGGAVVIRQTDSPERILNQLAKIVNTDDLAELAEAIREHLNASSQVRNLRRGV